MKSVRNRLLIAGSLVLVVLITSLGCTTTLGPRLAGWYAPIHNTLQSLGFVQAGPIESGALKEREAQTISVALTQGVCYAIVGMGSAGVNELELSLTAPGGATIASDTSAGRQAVMRACAQATGEYVIVVRAASGSGDFTVASWASSATAAMPGTTPGGMGAPPGPRGTCAEPLELKVGDTVSGGTTGGSEMSTATCAAGAPASIYALVIEAPSFVKVEMTSPYDGALAIASSCGEPSSEIHCNDDAGDANHSRVSALLQPGTYFVTVTGYNGQHGAFQLHATAEAVGDLDRLCSEAPALVPGQLVSGTTAGAPSRYEASCASGAGSPDALYRLEVTERSRVRVVLRTPGHDGALHMRATCYARSTEIACNDDQGDAQHSAIAKVLDPGTYYVVVDGYGADNAGPYTLKADVAPLGEADLVGNTCAKAVVLESGSGVSGTTLGASGDYQATCSADPAAPDRVYRFRLREESRVRAALPTVGFNAALYIQRDCGNMSSELVCGTPYIDRVLPRGSYSLIVDGQDAEAYGDYILTFDVRSSAKLRAMCDDLPVLRPNAPVRGETTGFGQFTASCGKDARGPEDLYRLELTRPSHVRILVESQYDAVLYLRSDCIRGETEVTCVDDSGGQDKALVDTLLPAGTYYVFVDTYENGTGGTYSVTLWVE